ncbi:DNA-directed RNA polymerase II subunit RPB9, partial [Lecanoromycetidae sp. Uapishka_2]
MASPAPSNASDTSDSKKPSKEDITFKFCRECSNMLYPKEDRMTNKLMFACRTCQFSEEASSSCVFRNTIHNTVGENSGVTQDVGSDPTVGGPSDELSDVCCTLCGREIEWHCMLCGEELEIMQLQVGGVEEDELGNDISSGEEENGVKVQGLTLEEMSRMEEDEDMDGEEDTTGDIFIPPPHGGRGWQGGA